MAPIAKPTYVVTRFLKDWFKITPIAWFYLNKLANLPVSIFRLYWAICCGSEFKFAVLKAEKSFLSLIFIASLSEYSKHSPAPVSSKIFWTSHFSGPIARIGLLAFRYSNNLPGMMPRVSILSISKSSNIGIGISLGFNRIICCCSHPNSVPDIFIFKILLTT